MKKGQLVVWALSASALLAIPALANAAPTSRDMNLLGWQEFAEMVPKEIDTVLIPVGTLEAHGVLPNGSDNLAPEAMAREISAELDALIAPTLNYGVTGSLDAFPGTFSISAETYEALLTEILTGLARNGFKNLVVLNGHGGGQTAILQRVSEKVGREQRVRTLVINWWSAASDITLQVFGEPGGHAGSNESAYVQAVAPDHVHKERYSDAMASPRLDGVIAYPFPSSIVLYEPGQGYPDFDARKADQYYKAVNQRVLEVITDTIVRWDRAGIFQ